VREREREREREIERERERESVMEMLEGETTKCGKPSPSLSPGDRAKVSSIAHPNAPAIL
jgi:hypothetical protein